jgi:hypothetical protein
MDINEERRTELLWRRIVDVRSNGACAPLDDYDRAVQPGELRDLQRLAEDTGDALNGELTRGRAAARLRLVQFIQANPAPQTIRAGKDKLRFRSRFSDRVLLCLALLFLAAAFAIAAISWNSSFPSTDCGYSVQNATGGSSGSARNSKPPPSKLLKSVIPIVNTKDCK